MYETLKKLKKDTRKLLNLSPKDKQEIILSLAKALRAGKAAILAANNRDLASFTRSEALKDRLLLNEKRFEALCASLEQIALLKDPVGRVLAGW